MRGEKVKLRFFFQTHILTAQGRRLQSGRIQLLLQLVRIVLALPHAVCVALNLRLQAADDALGSYNLFLKARDLLLQQGHVQSYL